MSVLFYVLLTLLPVSQDAAPAPEKPADKPACQIRGTVVDQEESAPIKNARAFLQPERASTAEDDYVVKTGADGKFCFTKIAAGRYHLGAAHNGHLTQHYGAEDFWSPGIALSLQKDQQLEPVLLRLQRASVISGRILDEDGEPAPEVTVQALIPTDLARAQLLTGDEQAPEHIQLMIAQSATTNDLGEYRLAGLPPAAYVVRAQINRERSMEDGFLRDVPDDDSHQPLPTFYPGTVRRGEAQLIEMAAGQDTTATFQLKHEKTVAVRGILLGDNGKPAAGAFVTLRSSDGNWPSSEKLNMADDSGHFKIENVLAGHYLAQAYGNFETAKGEGRQYAEQTVEVGADDVNNLRLLLKRGITVPARIAAEGSALPSGRLRVTMNGVGIAHSSGSNKIDKDGSFILPSVMPGTYKVRVFGLPESYYLKRIDYGGAGRSDGELVIEDGDPPGRLDLLVSPHAASIAGTIRDANDAAVGGMVIVLNTSGSKPGENEIKDVTNSDQNGQFSFHGLAPGAYTVLARKRVADPRTQPPHLEVHLAESDQKVITLKIE